MSFPPSVSFTECLVYNIAREHKWIPAPWGLQYHQKEDSLSSWVPGDASLWGGSGSAQPSHPLCCQSSINIYISPMLTLCLLPHCLGFPAKDLNLRYFWKSQGPVPVCIWTVLLALVFCLLSFFSAVAFCSDEHSQALEVLAKAMLAGICGGPLSLSSITVFQADPRRMPISVCILSAHLCPSGATLPLSSSLGFLRNHSVFCFVLFSTVSASPLVGSYLSSKAGVKRHIGKLLSHSLRLSLLFPVAPPPPLEQCLTCSLGIIFSKCGCIVWGCTSHLLLCNKLPQHRMAYNSIS